MSLDKPIDKFIEEQKNKYTLSKTRRDVCLLTKFLRAKNEAIKVDEIPPEELNGEDFEPSSLRGLICSFNWLFNACKYRCNTPFAVH